MIMRLVFMLFAALALVQQARAAEPVLFVEQPLVLEKLETLGYAFSGLFGVEEKDGLKGLHEQAPAYRAIAERITADVGDIRAEIEAGGRRLQTFTAAETGRVMDMRWLTTEAARFRLVGVVNRMDRQDFLRARGETDNCGEVRLIYRLAYAFRKDGRGKVLSSRMPFNFNAVFELLPDADGGCVGVASRWTPGIDERADAGWLAGGPLDHEALRFRQLELNAQVVRFPSGQEPEFGGQAVYLMRIFGIDGGRMREKTLENTPDTARIAADAALKAELAAYVAEHVEAIDSGVYQIPETLLATRVISYSTFGNVRQVNHPFVGLLDDAALAGLDLSDGRLVRSPQALRERLDNGACQGCHQAGATAGFHFIGLDDHQTSPLNRIEVGISPHFAAELPRRAAWLAAAREEREPNRFRPLSFAPSAIWEDEGAPAYEAADATMPCIAEGDAAAFGGIWSCGGGTSCMPLAASGGDGIALAQCLLPADSDDMFSGHPCLAGEVTDSTDRPFNDRYGLTQFTAFATKASAVSYTCRPPRIGVPGGMAYRQCGEADRAFSAFKADADMPREVCGLTGGKKFDLCVATGNFDQCLAGAVQRGNRAACSAEHFCRDDYICQVFPDDTPNVKKIKGVGFCSPTYFLFQMRIDNHATPWRTRERMAYRSIEVPDDEDEDEQW